MSCEMEKSENDTLNVENTEIDLKPQQIKPVFNDNSIFIEMGQNSKIWKLVNVSNEKELREYVEAIKERADEMETKIGIIMSQVKEICGEEGLNSYVSSNQIMILTELFNEVHLMSDEMRQIKSHLKSVNDYQPTNNMEQIENAEREVNRVIEELDLLKADLHKEMSKLIQNIEKQQSESDTSKYQTQKSNSTDAPLNQFEDLQISESNSSSECTQIKFIADYMQTLIRNIEEIETTVSQIYQNLNELDLAKIKEKIKEIKVMERHLNRNEPLIKEIEFWLCYDISKSQIAKDYNYMEFLKDKFEKLSSALSRTKLLIAEKHITLKEFQEKLKLKNDEQIRKKESKVAESPKKHAKSNSSQEIDAKSDDSVGDLNEFVEFRHRERKNLYREIEEAMLKLNKLKKLLNKTDVVLQENRYIQITNDYIVARHGHIYKMQIEALKMHKEDLEWLLSFTDPVKLCKTEVPDKLIYEIIEIKQSYKETLKRVEKAQENLSKIRELWILFEYYVMRIILWNKAVSLGMAQNRDNLKNWQKEARIIEKKIPRVLKIKRILSNYISEFSTKIIDQIWSDTQSQFKTIQSKL